MRFFFFVASYFISSLAFGQELNITGVVIDENGIVLPYTAVTIYKGLNGTMANKRGEFSITVNKGDSLVFTRIGNTKFGYEAHKSVIITIQLSMEPCIIHAINLSNITFNSPQAFRGKIISEKVNKDPVSSKKKSASSIPQDEIIRVFNKVEISPSLNGDIYHAFKDIKRNGHWDDMGVLQISFLITNDNRIDSVEVIKSFKKDIDEQIIKVFPSQFQAWAAEQNGRKVSTRCLLDLAVIFAGEKAYVNIVGNHNSN